MSSFKCDGALTSLGVTDEFMTNDNLSTKHLEIVVNQDVIGAMQMGGDL